MLLFLPTGQAVVMDELQSRRAGVTVHSEMRIMVREVVHNAAQ